METLILKRRGKEYTFTYKTATDTDVAAIASLRSDALRVWFNTEAYKADEEWRRAHPGEERPILERMDMSEPDRLAALGLDNYGLDYVSGMVTTLEVNGVKQEWGKDDAAWKTEALRRIRSDILDPFED